LLTKQYTFYENNSNTTHFRKSEYNVCVFQDVILKFFGCRNLSHLYHVGRKTNFCLDTI